MVPHSLFVSSDRHVDLALNLLTLAVSGALIASLAYFALALLRPAPSVTDHGDVGPPVWAAMTPKFRPQRLEFDLALPRLPVIYRCEQAGEVTYTDHPCLAGRVQPLLLRPS